MDWILTNVNRVVRIRNAPALIFKQLSPFHRAQLRAHTIKHVHKPNQLLPQTIYHSILSFNLRPGGGGGVILTTQLVFQKYL